jgi:hypothetical protein
MPQNISKYIAISDFLLLEYEFNKDGIEVDLNSEGISSILANTVLGSKQYFNTGSQGILNNDLVMNSEPNNSRRSSWYTYPQDTSAYWNYFDSSALITQASYPFDTVRVHVVSGYNFDDVPGFLLQIQAKDTSDNLVDLSNFTWINQSLPGGQVIKFASNALYLANKFYDKYIELKIPSVEALAGQSDPGIENALLIKALSDVYFTYSTIPEIDVDTYLIQERIALQLPTTSQADNFNAFIAESAGGDFIEFYATWNSLIIGEYMGDIESGRIRLYTSNNPNDNFEDFSDTYGAGAQKWVVMHELYVYEHIPGNSILTQQYVFTQENNFSLPNYFRPVIKNSDIASSYSIDYICRLTNRMDGTQIIRKASFASVDPKKYGRYFTRLNVDNYIPYKVFNRIEGEASTTINVQDNRKSKFVKVYYDSTRILLNMNNEVLPQGTGPLFLKKGDGTYKFSFDKIDENAGGEQKNVDLSGAYQYALLFVLDDDSKIEISPTFSTNMNTTLGELEFKIMEEQILQLLKQNNNTYSIIIKNPDRTQYTFYEGVFFPYSNYQQVISQYSSLFDITGLQTTISELESEISSLRAENSALRTS